MITSSKFLFAMFNIALLVIIFIAVHLLAKKTAQSGWHKDKPVDELTGFMTRHTFGRLFERIISTAKQSVEPLTLILVDIDHFRLINEKYGHEIGDKVLFQLSQSIDSVLRASDITCRWEGDTVLIALKNCTERDGCRLAQKILEKVRNQHLTSPYNQHIFITASIGITQLTNDDDSHSLLHRTETGLLSARDNGRNRCAIGYEWILIDYACEPIF